MVMYMQRMGGYSFSVCVCVTIGTVLDVNVDRKANVTFEQSLNEDGTNL